MRTCVPRIVGAERKRGRFGHYVPDMVTSSREFRGIGSGKREEEKTRLDKIGVGGRRMAGPTALEVIDCKI